MRPVNLKPQGLAQLDQYPDGLRTPIGWLMIFDRRSGQPPVEARTTVAATESTAGRRISMVRA